MKNILLNICIPFLLTFPSINTAADLSTVQDQSNIVIKSKRIILEEFPEAWNPSLARIDKGYLLVFRYTPDGRDSGVSYIGITVLNEQFESTGKTELLDTRTLNIKTPSRSEDARIFVHRDEFYIIYNDNLDSGDRRDMYIAKILQHEGSFFLSTPLKLFHPHKYGSVPQQKNWVPFEWNGIFLISYSLNPHEILHPVYPKFDCGSCQPIYETFAPIKWKWGALRGGTPAILVDGEYLAFFHSNIWTTSASSQGQEMWHYYMGAYTFSSEPPFELNTISSSPIIGEGFYTRSDYAKRVIFPGGYVVNGSKIYLAYGKDDSEIWIATIDKEALKRSMVQVRKKPPGSK